MGARMVKQEAKTLSITLIFDVEACKSAQTTAVVRSEVYALEDPSVMHYLMSISFS